jgi:hypothetical protein
MSAAKKGSKKTAKRSTRKRRDSDTHVIDYQPESPVIREHEAVERRRRGFRTAMWMIAAMIIIGLGWVTWHEALEKNSQFLLKAVEVNTEGTLTREQIVAATGLTTATNLLTMNLREVRAKIERLPQVKSAVIHRDYHGKLTLDVVQRLPVAWIECAKLEAHGAAERQRLPDGCRGRASAVRCDHEAMSRDAAHSISRPQRGCAGKVVPDLQVHAALRLMQELQKRDEDGRAKLERIEIPNAWSLVAHFAGEAKITFGVDDLEPQLARFDRFIREARAAELARGHAEPPRAGEHARHLSRATGCHRAEPGGHRHHHPTAR